MLVNYKTDYQKIAMGFLSFEDDLKSFANLKAELELFAGDEAHGLYLYREEDNVNCNFSGVVGVELGSDYVLVRHLDLAPANRIDQDYFALLDDLRHKFAPKKIMGSLDVTPIIMRWEEEKKD